MTILQQIKQKAANLHKTIVLCEGEDSRVVKAAADATKEGIAKIVLLGNEEEIRLHNPDVDLTGVTIVNHLTSDKLPAYNEKLCQLRASKGMTPEQAAELLKDATYFGAMMLKNGRSGRTCFRRVPFHGKHAAPRSANNQRRRRAYPPSPASTLMLCPEQGNQYCPDGSGGVCRLRT